IWALGRSRSEVQLIRSLQEANTHHRRKAVGFSEGALKGTEQPQDAGARDLQDVGDITVGQAAERVEAELAWLLLDVDPVQTERVEVGIESQIRAHALHCGDGTALAAAEPSRLEVSLMPAEYRGPRTDERGFRCRPLKEQALRNVGRCRANAQAPLTAR